MNKLLLIAAFCLSACGFHLKGTQQQLALENIYVMNSVEKPNEAQQQAYAALLEALRDSGVQVQESAADSQYKLVVGDFQFASRQVAIGGDSGNSRELEIVDGYRIALFDKDKALGDSHISSRSNISYSAGQYIGSTQEERNTHQQLARENAQTTLRFIRAKLAK